MFEIAEVGHSVDKKSYKQRAKKLRQELLVAQRGLRAAGIPCILLFKGVNAAGKSETVNRLAEWMDPRWITTNAYREPTEVERERPRMWRYWRDLPAKGRIGVFMSAWYSRAFVARAGDGVDIDEHLSDALEFERTLADEGAIILKFWMHLGRDEQAAVLEKMADDPDEAWRVSEADWEEWRRYDDFIGAAEEIITRTSTGHAPWHIVEGTDWRYRELRVGEIVRDAIRERLDRLEAAGVQLVTPGPRDRATGPGPGATAVIVPPADEDLESSQATEVVTVFDGLEMPTVERDEYKAAMKAGQARLGKLHRRAREAGVPTVLVFEGPDAAGKGGSIRRLTGATDARWTRVVPIAAPSDEERAHHYMWRFWRKLPRAGELTIFDRSWYGRVLVERVEGFATRQQWKRAYAEINQFERELVEHGTVVLKFWVHITSEEQEQRFLARQETPHKAWKLTDEDWRNRSRWDDYALAAHEMIGRTSMRSAPWIVVPGNDKKHARLTVLDAVCDALEKRLD